MNEKIIEALQDMATFEDYNKRQFPARAYRNAVKTIQGLDFVVDSADQVEGLPGIGEGILKKIDLLLTTGTFPRYEEFKASAAAAIKDMAKIKGIGMQKAKTLSSFGITSLDELRSITKDLKPGDKIYNPNEPSETITFTKAMKIGLDYEAHTDKTRMPIDEHDSIVAPLLEEIKKVPGVVEASATGSARRYDGSAGYTVGDIDLIIGIDSESAVGKIAELMDEMLDEIIMSGSTKISGIKNRRQVDVRITSIDDYGAMLLHSTGPTSFNVICRKIAIDHGWKLNEYGLFDKNGKCLSRDEKGILKKLGIGWVDPTERKSYQG